MTYRAPTDSRKIISYKFNKLGPTVSAEAMNAIVESIAYNVIEFEREAQTKHVYPDVLEELRQNFRDLSTEETGTIDRLLLQKRKVNLISRLRSAVHFYLED